MKKIILSIFVFVGMSAFSQNMNPIILKSTNVTAIGGSVIIINPNTTTVGTDGAVNNIYNGQAVGLNELTAQRTYNLYPNPTIDVININEISDITLFDNSGREIESFKGVNKVDVSSLLSGVYFASVNSSKLIRFVKL